MPLTHDSEFAKVLQPLLPMLAARPIPEVHDVQARREILVAMVNTMADALPDTPGVSVDTLIVKSYDGADITVLHVYAKEAPLGAPTSAFIHAHGGGMIAGSPELFTKAISMRASATGAQFFSVGYRKAPEYPHPAPTEDVFAALKWLNENAAKVNVDPARIGVSGESAGGGIVAGVAIMARDRQLSPPLAKQVLIYPMLDDRNLTPIAGLEELAFWRVGDNITGWTALLGDKAGKEGVSPYAAPARVESVEGLPPIYIDIGDLDIFKFENIEYIARFAKANISTEFHIYPGLPHAWEGLALGISASKRAIENRNRVWSSI